MVCRLVSLLHPSSKEAISHYLVGEITGLGKECPIVLLLDWVKILITKEYLS